jgi:hypothetical protein
MNVSTCRYLLKLLDAQGGELPTISGSLTEQLITAIRESTYSSFGELWDAHEKRFTWKRGAFDTAVSRLRQLLLNNLAKRHYDNEENTKPSIYDIESWHAFAQFLLRKGSTAEGFDILVYVLRYAQAEEHIALEYAISCDIVRRSAVDSNFKLFKYYSTLLDTVETKLISWQRLKRLESQAIMVLQEESSDEASTRLQHILQEIETLAIECGTLRATIISSRIHIWYYECTGNYVGICERSAQLLTNLHTSSSKITVQETVLAEFETHRLAAFGRLRDVKACLTATEEAQRHLKAGSSNWLTYKEHVLLVMLSLKQFRHAAKVFSEFEQFKSKSLPTIRRQRLILYRSYLRYAVDHSSDANMVEFLSIQSVSPNLLSTQCSELVTFKEGFNASILILRLLVLIQRKAFGDTLLMEDSLRAYLRRNTARAPNSRRTHCFLAFLTGVIRSNFDWQSITVLSSKCRDELTSLENVFDEAEIIPYDHLLDCMLLDIQDGAISAPITRQLS